MATMIKHYVTFLSPGTFVAETTTREVATWDVDEAAAMAQKITERYDATPYGFQFSTRERGDDDFDSKETARSGVYYLGCVVKSIDDLRAENDPRNEILISNMEANDWPRVVQTTKGWKWTQPLREDDVVLPLGEVAAP